MLRSKIKRNTPSKNLENIFSLLRIYSFYRIDSTGEKWIQTKTYVKTLGSNPIKRNSVLKRANLVLNYLMVRYYSLDKTNRIVPRSKLVFLKTIFYSTDSYTRAFFLPPTHTRVYSHSHLPTWMHRFNLKVMKGESILVGIKCK